MAKISIKNLSFTYPGSHAPVLRDINLDIEQGEFLLVIGASGSGKTTLLRHMKPALTPAGARDGGVFTDGILAENIPDREQAAMVGFVLQNPESQIVMDKVWHELSFGLENLGIPKPEIRRKVAEMAGYFGIESWYHRDTHELSGGEKQLLSLAAVMTMQPDVLILDEPTASLDPINASDFLMTLHKMNRDIGTSIIITEHRIEEVMSLADRVIVMDGGQITHEGTPAEVGASLTAANDIMLSSMPTPMRVFAELSAGGILSKEPDAEKRIPITVREGRRMLEQLFHGRCARLPASLNHSDLPSRPDSRPVLSMNSVYFRYERDGQDVLKGLTLDVNKGEIFAIVGGNGAGKTTVLSLLCRLRTPYRGKVNTIGNISLLPQDPQVLFTKKTIGEELKNTAQKYGATDCLVSDIARQMQIEYLLDSHPYDVSAGEQQRAALAKLLLTKPDILLLDEPTSGMDSIYKTKLAKILKDLASTGKTIVIVSHDIEFCASHVDRSALLFDGNIVSEGTSKEFFAGNSYYTTSASRMSRHIIPGLVTAQDIMDAFTDEAENV